MSITNYLLNVISDVKHEVIWLVNEKFVVMRVCEDRSITTADESIISTLLLHFCVFLFWSTSIEWWCVPMKIKSKKRAQKDYCQMACSYSMCCGRALRSCGRRYHRSNSSDHEITGSSHTSPPLFKQIWCLVDNYVRIGSLISHIRPHSSEQNVYQNLVKYCWRQSFVILWFSSRNLFVSKIYWPVQIPCSRKYWNNLVTEKLL